MESYGPYFNLLLNMQSASDEVDLLQKAFEAHLELSGSEFLESFQYKVNQLNDILSMFIVNAKRQHKRMESLSEDKFIPEFSKSKPILSKKEIKDLCGITKGTLKSHAQSFIDFGQTGVDTLTFLKWLEKYKGGERYRRFKKNLGV